MRICGRVLDRPRVQDYNHKDFLHMLIISKLMCHILNIERDAIQGDNTKEVKSLAKVHKISIYNKSLKSVVPFHGKVKMD